MQIRSLEPLTQNGYGKTRGAGANPLRSLVDRLANLRRELPWLSVDPSAAVPKRSQPFPLNIQWIRACGSGSRCPKNRLWIHQPCPPKPCRSGAIPKVVCGPGGCCPRMFAVDPAAKNIERGTGAEQARVDPLPRQQFSDEMNGGTHELLWFTRIR